MISTVFISQRTCLVLCLYQNSYAWYCLYITTCMLSTVLISQLICSWLSFFTNFMFSTSWEVRARFAISCHFVLIGVRQFTHDCLGYFVTLPRSCDWSITITTSLTNMGKWITWVRQEIWYNNKIKSNEIAFVVTRTSTDSVTCFPFNSFQTDVLTLQSVVRWNILFVCSGKRWTGINDV